MNRWVERGVYTCVCECVCVYVQYACIEPPPLFEFLPFPVDELCWLESGSSCLSPVKSHRRIGGERTTDFCH